MACTGFTTDHFELTLDWRGDPSVGPGSAGDIWNIDDFPMVTVASRTTGRHTKKLLPSNEKALGQWNHYRILLNHSHLTLTVNGQVQNTAHWCKELSGPIALQSEGVPIEFRNVRLRPIQ